MTTRCHTSAEVGPTAPTRSPTTSGPPPVASCSWSAPPTGWRRSARGPVYQSELPQEMGVGQRRVPAIEHGDLALTELGTVRAFVEALGAQGADHFADLGDRTIDVTWRDDHAPLVGDLYTRCARPAVGCVGARGAGQGVAAGVDAGTEHAERGAYVMTATAPGRAFKITFS